MCHQCAHLHLDDDEAEQGVTLSGQASVQSSFRSVSQILSGVQLPNQVAGKRAQGVVIDEAGTIGKGGDHCAPKELERHPVLLHDY